MMEQREPGFRWDYAVTSKNDRICPPENMNAYWKMHKSTRQIIVPLPHYFFQNWNSYTDFIRFVERYKRRSAPTNESVAYKSDVLNKNI
jgi:hypothetical protein